MGVACIFLRILHQKVISDWDVAHWEQLHKSSPHVGVSDESRNERVVALCVS